MTSSAPLKKSVSSSSDVQGHQSPNDFHVTHPPYERSSSFARHTRTLEAPTGDEKEKHLNPVTLTRFIHAESQLYKESTGDFALLLQSIQLACKIISSMTRKAGIANLYGLTGTENTSGDSQKKLDILANDVMVNCVTFSEQVYIIGTEENDDPIIIDTEKGGYAIVFDPLDGSSNIDCNLSVGTIFGIYKKDPAHSGQATVKDLLRPGTELVAAGYCSYDAATMMTLTTGRGVNMFTLDPQLGEFILTHRQVKIPKKGKIYSVNEGNSESWDDAFKEYMNSLKSAGTYSGRYVGSMVGDIHRTLLYGGIFCYPPDKKAPNGKLRIVYECNPISMIVEQAGGKSSTGRGRVLEVVPTALHQRCPIFVGSSEDVKAVEEFYKRTGRGTRGPDQATAKL